MAIAILIILAIVIFYLIRTEETGDQYFLTKEE